MQKHRSLSGFNTHRKSLISLPANDVGHSQLLGPGARERSIHQVGCSTGGVITDGGSARPPRTVPCVRHRPRNNRPRLAGSRPAEPVKPTSRRRPQAPRTVGLALAACRRSDRQLHTDQLAPYSTRYASMNDTITARGGRVLLQTAVCAGSQAVAPSCRYRSDRYPLGLVILIVFT